VPEQSDKLLTVDDLAVHFFTEDGVARAVDGVSFQVGRQETLCLVGESGCGKSVTALAIMQLVQAPPGKIVSGSIHLGATDLLALDDEEMRRVRGNRIGMVFQEPMTSLNPVFTIGTQITEAVRLHRDVDRHEAHSMGVDMLRRVRIPEPVQRMDEYPHQLSGGMKQRVMIAMALVCRPELVIADEPTTALDVTIQAQILDLLTELQEEMGMSVMMITHDLGVVAETADHVAVMYAGRVVEYSDVGTIFHNPRHPYLISLFRSLPVVGNAGKRLDVIPGAVPDPRHHPSGCRFHPRCFMAGPECSEQDPELRELEPGHWAACLRREGYEDAPPLSLSHPYRTANAE
jgi:peptide/nickel transport system ATP-binding protein/oligopeptide transport system ATP-binding protein